MILYQHSHSEADHRRPQDHLIQVLKEDPGAETGRPNTVAGLREQAAHGKQTMLYVQVQKARSIIIIGTTWGQAGRASTTPRAALGGLYQLSVGIGRAGLSGKLHFLHKLLQNQEQNRPQAMGASNLSI